MKSRLWVLLVAAVLAGVGWYGLRGNGDADVTRYRTASIDRGNVIAGVASTGTITPVASIQISSQVSGQVVEVLADFNSEVRADQVIARIDSQTFEQRVLQAEADLEAARAQVLVQRSQVQARRADLQRAQANLAEARRDLARKDELVAKRFLATAERDRAATLARTLELDTRSATAAVDVAIAQVRSAEALVRQREASVAGAHIDLKRTAIRSPVDGIVIKRSVDAGQTVAASLQAPELFVIARNLADMQVECSVDESDIGRVQPGQQASFTVDAFPGTTVTGRVDQVRKAANNVQNVITYVAVVRFSNASGIMLPGMTANVRILTDRRENVLRVPNAALRFRPPAGSRAEAMEARAGSRPSSGSVDGASTGTASDRRRAFRARLVRELALTEAQQAQVDGIFDAMRPKYLAIRSATPSERADLVRATRAETGSRIAAILDPRQRKLYEAMVAQTAGRAASGGRGRVYLVVDGKPTAREVRTGVSDGAFTEISGSGVAVGDTVIVGAQRTRPQSGNRLPAL